VAASLFLLKVNSSFTKRRGSRTNLRDARTVDVQERHKGEITDIIPETEISVTDGKHQGEFKTLLLILLCRYEIT